jgi:anaerobic selenocysteine-containing dehydrogenase
VTREVRTQCPYCGVGCGLIARVRDGRLRGPVVFWHAGGTPGLFEKL